MKNLNDQPLEIRILYTAFLNKQVMWTSPNNLKGYKDHPEAVRIPTINKTVEHKLWRRIILDLHAKGYLKRTIEKTSGLWDQQTVTHYQVTCAGQALLKELKLIR